MTSLNLEGQGFAIIMLVSPANKTGFNKSAIIFARSFIYKLPWPCHDRQGGKKASMDATLVALTVAFHPRYAFSSYAIGLS